ncbi:SIMPL domain-containing protein [Enorma phocaeensis]|uniref:SIMPL domain-containing protein n=1 Tax=Enorma phocaeensis TaxID=1871019 RepID=UPI000C830DD2|nr:SIMPL domain-containing protein [Enorma phocaeensis]
MNAKETMAKPVVCVNATVEDSVEPDIAEFRIWFQGHGADQTQCAKQYAGDVKRVQDALKKLGIEDAFKTSAYTSYANRSRRGRTITGYEYSARGTLLLKRAEYDVSAIWTVLAKSEIRATLDVHFSLDDADAEEAKLLGRAFDKARGSAEALAVAAGKQLGEVRQISYKRRDAFADPPYCFRESAGGTEDLLPDLNPEPIEVECSVDVDWWLE